jgi:hypothetical protein
MLTTHHQETLLLWGDEHAWIGLLHDSVGQVPDARGIDDSDQVKLDAPGLQTVQRPGAATQHHRHQTDNQLVEQAGPQALLDDRWPWPCSSYALNPSVTGGLLLFSLQRLEGSAARRTPRGLQWPAGAGRCQNLQWAGARGSGT